MNFKEGDWVTGTYEDNENDMVHVKGGKWVGRITYITENARFVVIDNSMILGSNCISFATEDQIMLRLLET